MRKDTNTIGSTNEKMFFFESNGSRLFGVLHVPIEERNKKPYGWIFCSAFAEERGFSQRLMVEWARVLCKEGYFVLRFDYRGYGDSDGNFEEFTVENYFDDLENAIIEFQKRASVPVGGLCGLRLGASIATIGAHRFVPNARLILWEPIISGEKYADQLLRFVMAKEMSDTGRAPRTRDQLKQCLKLGEQVIIEGHALTYDIFKSLVEINLMRTDRRLEGPIQIVQFSKTPKANPRSELSDFKKHLAKSSDIQFNIMKMPLLWSQSQEYAVRPKALFDATCHWLKNLDYPQEMSEQEIKSQKILKSKMKNASTYQSLEKPIEFQCKGDTLRGLLHLPHKIELDRPAVILLSPGFNCRTARYRLYVHIAREIVNQGWVTLRFDPHGLGDSDGFLAYRNISDLYVDIESGLFVPDVLSAIRYIKEDLGIGSVVLIGLCGGAAATVHTASQTESVVAMVPMELPLKHTFTGEEATINEGATLPLAQADHFLKSYVNKIFSLSAWLNFFSLKSNYKGLFKSITVSIGKRIGVLKREKIDDKWFINKLGPRANLDLISRLQMVLKKGIPTFFVFGTTYAAWNFEEVKSGLLPNKKKNPTIQQNMVKRADPGFSLPQHRRELIDVLIYCLNNERLK